MTSSKSVSDSIAETGMTAILQPSNDILATSVEDSHLAAAIMECKGTLKGQMDLIASDVSKIRQDLDGFKARVSEVESRFSTLKT